MSGSGAESCALDVAARGPHSLQGIGELFGLHKERIRQIEEQAVERLRDAAALERFRGSDGRVRLTVLDRIYEAGP